jgi:hypothetical protein
MARKARKWSNLPDDVAPAQPVDELSPWFQDVLKEKGKYVTTLVDGDESKMNMDLLATEWAKLEAEEAAEEEARTLRNKRYEALSLMILPRLESIQALSGQDTWRGGGQTFSPKVTLRPIVRDKAKLREWLEDRDMEDTLELPSGRLNSIVTEAFEQEQASYLTPAQRANLPAGMPGSMLAPPGVEVFRKTTVNRTARGGAPKEED